jgi:hypothetical protein
MNPHIPYGISMTSLNVQVNLFRYPCIDEGSKCVSYAAHSSHVMNIRGSVGDEYLISVGGNDKCVIVWKHTLADSSNGASAGAGVVSSPSHGSPHGHDAGPLHVDDIAVEVGGGGLDDLLMKAPTGGDEAGCVKPWWVMQTVLCT